MLKALSLRQIKHHRSDDANNKFPSAYSSTEYSFKKVSPPIMYILCLQLRKVIGLILSILLPLAELENKMVCTLEE